MLEHLALRQQLLVLNRTTKTPALRHSDRLFSAVLSATWSRRRTGRPPTDLKTVHLNLAFALRLTAPG